MPFLSTIKLISSGALIVGDIPRKATLAEVANKVSHQKTRKSHIRSFGLFDNNTSNYNTYYPNVTAKDLKPSKDEFIEPVFRALSEVIVHKDYNPVDFSMGKVLRKSMPLLKGQTVNTDHEDAVGNAIGAVSEVSWQEAYKDSNGILIPAGINSRLKIDGKSHPRVARAIMMDPPAIHSTSVTVQFLWEKSHAEMSDEQFFKNLGGYDKEGKLIRRIASDVNRYHEISLVSHGADPFAQKIKENGELNNSPYASISYNSVKPEEKKKQNMFFFDFKSDILKNSKKITIPDLTIINKPSQNKKGMKKLLGILTEEFGLKEFKPEDATSIKALKKAIKELKDKATGNEATTQQLTEANTKVEKLQKRYEKLKADKAKRLEAKRKSVLKNYTLSVSGEKDDKVVETINNADDDVLDTLNKEYLKKIDAKFPSTCASCGSTDITKASGSQGEEGDNPDAPKTDAQIESEFEDEWINSSLKVMH